MDIWALVKILLKRKWILILVPLISGSLAFAFKYFSKHTFSSSAQISTGITIQDDLAGTAKYFNPYEISVTFDNLIESIKSRPVVNLVSYRLVLHDLESPNKPFSERSKTVLHQLDAYGGEEAIKSLLQSKLETFASLDPNKPDEKKIQKLIEQMGYDYGSLQKGYDIGRLNKTDYINIKFTGGNKFLCAFFVNELCKEFIRFYTNQKTSQSDVSLSALEIMLNQKKEIMDEKLLTLKNFKSRNSLIDSDIEKEGIIKQISTYEALVEQEKIKVRGLTLSLDNVVSRINNYNQSFTDPSQRNSNLVELKERIDKLNERYIITGSKNQSLLDSLKTLRQTYQREIAKGKNTPDKALVDITDLQEKRNQLEVDIDISRSNLSLTESKLRSLRYSIGDFATVEANASALEGEIEMAKTEYLDAQDKFNKAKEKVASTGIKIKQVLFGEPAERPESSKIIFFAIFGAVLSFVVCVAFIVGIEFADIRFKTPGQFKRLTKLKLAGSLIRINEKKINNLGLLFKDSKQDEEAIQLNQFLRKLRFEVEALNKKVFLVTSTKKGEGKSFFVVSLAYTLSLMRKRVLIIDTNLRNNTLTTKLINKQTSRHLLTYQDHTNNGVVHVPNPGEPQPKTEAPKNEQKAGGEGQNKNEKNGAASDSGSKSKFISKTANAYIDVIGSTQSELSPSEILSGLEFDTLIEVLKNEYDYIFLEGAALNDFSDTKELIQFVDAVIPVFSAKSSVKDIDKDSISFLKSLGPKLGPSVLNMVEKNDLVS